ncbi:MAG: putative baseplate assembly protein [Chloroflexi bacterium]|nr:putative baseplate assembly protein [Chloroflexota bacterium]
MPLPEPILDDLRFQSDIVDEARRRIIRYCPEWTEYNLSDPGITLIELFAWMTEMITYRMNLVPEKNYIRFMDLLGIQLQPASSARAELLFRLATPLPIAPDDITTVRIPRSTEVATRATDEAAEVIFTTDAELMVVPPRLSQLRRTDEFHRNFSSRLGVELFYPFSRQDPAMGETFYVGFDPAAGDLRGHILQMRFETEETQATGVRREDPPLVWECSTGPDRWDEITPSTRAGEKDTTGGLNNPSGQIVFYLPTTLQAADVQGVRAQWVRCRIEQRRTEQGMYTQSPRIRDLAVFTLGATAASTHAVPVYEELLGTSNGDANQVFHLRNTPVLDLAAFECVEIEEVRDGETVFVPWQRVADFSQSDRHERHFMLDTASGEVRFGPNVRQRDGTMKQYGRVPGAGAAVRFNQYRFGGGVAGNVPANRLTSLKSSIPYVDTVTNPKPADGGRDQESLDEAKMRARREMRAQQRAVTAEDYEDLSKTATREIARVRCNRLPNSALAPGQVELLVVPSCFDALRAGDLSRLEADANLRKRLVAHLDPYRLLTTTIQVSEPKYIGVKVTAEIVPSEYVKPETVRERVLRALRVFLNPLDLRQSGSDGWNISDTAMGDALPENYEGWPFGRDLYISELFAFIQKVPGVKHVRDIHLAQRAVVPNKEVNLASESGDSGRPLTAVTGRRIEVPGDTLICSLAHDVQIVEL